MKKRKLNKNGRIGKRVPDSDLNAQLGRSRYNNPGMTGPPQKTVKLLKKYSTTWLTELAYNEDIVGAGRRHVCFKS